MTNHEHADDGADDGGAVDEINRVLAEGLAGNSPTLVYHCEYCGLSWDSGRDARQHAINEHDDMGGYRSEVVDQ